MPQFNHGSVLAAAPGGVPAWLAQVLLNQLWNRFQQPDQNVLIPQTGAAPYWYVDPRAATLQQPRARSQATSQATSQEAAVVPEEIPTEKELSSQEQTQNYHEQERADMYDRIAHPGMLETPNVDNEIAEGTGTFEMDGDTYILPTQVGGVALNKDEALQRFKDTGDHLGVFDNPKDALFYERHYLTP